MNKIITLLLLMVPIQVQADCACLAMRAYDDCTVNTYVFEARSCQSAWEDALSAEYRFQELTLTQTKDGKCIFHHGVLLKRKDCEGDDVR